MSEQAGTKSAASDPAEGEVPGAAHGSLEDEQTAAETRSLLAGLGTVAPPTDRSERVPQLIERRSRGRFFGRRKLYERIPFVWVSLVMLIVAALLYAVMRLAPSVMSSP